MELTLQAQGRDDLGKFKVVIPEYCSGCDSSSEVVIQYNLISLQRGLGEIKREKTIMKSDKIGVTCGCYAKFHRQVAHIRDKMSKKK